MVDIKELKKLSQNITVLYVEDDLAILKAMQTYLKKFFLKVVSAENGLEGLQKYKEEKFDLVISDLSMPKINGIEMLQQIKEINEDQAILITSAHGESDYMLNAIKIGIDGYIIKPVDFAQLNQELFKAVQKLHKFSQNREYKEQLEEMVKLKTKELEALLEYESENYERTLYLMVEMIEERDTYTAGHSKRVAKYAQIIAQEMGYSKEDCTKIYQAGILHDIGKIATPDTVLLNPRKLNEIEYKLIQEHVSVGYKLLKRVPIFQSLAEIIVAHHERYDGKGYPNALKGDEIPPMAQIMIVADAFDAMTTNRIYKRRKTLKEALSELQELSAIQFSPHVVPYAIKALKSIHIDKSITQLPRSVLEQERFAYFYKDTLCGVYNQNYFDVMLMQNSHEKEFTTLNLFYLKNFSHYNKTESWSQGDKILKSFANLLEKHFSNSFIFRIFGDDFAVLSHSNYDLTFLEEEIEELLFESEIACEIKSIRLNDFNISSLHDLESQSP